MSRSITLAVAVVAGFVCVNASLGKYENTGI